MPSEKVINILRSKSELSESEIQQMSEREAWAWVYKNNPPQKRRDSRDQVCFTGFKPLEKERLIDIANSNDMNVVKSVTKNLKFLITGENPGPSKFAKAKDQNATILNEIEFYNLITTGELPNDNRS